jgi:type II secretory pathway pseudopilin PulG
MALMLIFNPEKYIPPAAPEECGWFCKNKYIILYVLLGLILAGLLFAYVMWRVSRYITKYRQAKKQMDNFRDQITEMEKAQTDVVGQTLRDKIEGITFTTNPAYSKGDKEGSDKRVELNTAIGALSARDRLLEENNKSLDERNKNLMNEIETLRKEKDSYKQVGSIEGGGQGLKNASEFE